MAAKSALIEIPSLSRPRRPIAQATIKGAATRMRSRRMAAGRIYIPAYSSMLLISSRIPLMVNEGPTPIPKRIQTALDLALELMLSNSRISKTNPEIGKAKRRMPIGVLMKFLISSVSAFPMVMKIPAVIMINGITSELRASGLHELVLIHWLSSLSLGADLIQVFVNESYCGAPLTWLPIQLTIIPKSNSFLRPERKRR